MKPFKLKRPNIKTRTVFSIFFWLFNLSLLLVVLVGFVPFIGIAILSDALRGEVPISILVPVFGLVGVPTTSTVMGIQRQRRLNATHRLQSQGKGEPHPTHQPISLVQLFFGIEAPLLMACTIRLFFLRDLTPASTFIFTSIALGTLAFSHWLLTDRHREPSATSWLHLAGLTTMLLLSLYLSAIALFYAIPIIQTVIIGIFYSFLLIVLLPIFFPLIMLLSGLTIMPWGMLVLFLRSWRQTLNALSTRYGTARPRAVIGGVLAVWLGLIVILQQQPQAQAFALLEQHPQSEGDRLALLEKSDTIRRGLLNAYLGAYRYPLLSNRGMYNTYRHYIGFPEGASEQLQAAYNTVLSPFAYQGTELDKEKAAQLYAEFFDTPILRGEHDAIQTAVLSNFNRSEAKAGLLDINAERVALRQQDVTVTPQGDWAAIELHEEYANTTFDDTEILYYFSLPESATLTGLWLGETGDRAQRYEYVVAPRGAAQEVYNEQVRRRIDPALLEQVGPRNYRLRAFPIPPAGQDRLPEDGEPDTMHLWMTYNVMKQNDQWMLPVLNERRNIFWTEDTKRTINGKQERGNTEWLPVSIPADASEPTAHQVEFSEGYIVAQPLDANDYKLPENQRFALILDRSYSMAAHRKDVENSIQWLKDNVLESNTFDLYLTDVDATQAEKISTLDTFDPKSVVYYGTMQTRQLLEQYQQAIAPTSQNDESPDAESPDYGAIILLTDSGSYELTHDGSPVELSAPLWLVHLGGLQAAYDDATLETIQNTGGNTTDNLETAMTRIATQPSLGDGTSLLNVVDGYAWFLRQTPDPTATTTDTMAPMAARQWIAQVSEAVKPDQLHQLDAIHQVAKDTSIVTPYSSMLVLVNTQQEEQLKEAESRSDRFDREIEDQQLPEPQDAIAPVSAVPEPAEWLLLMACVALLGGWYWQKESTTPYEDDGAIASMKS